MPTARSKESYESGGQGGDFGLLREDSYIFEIVRMENKGKVPAWGSTPDDPKMETDIRLFAKPLSYEGDTETPIADDRTGEEINPDKTVQIFFKPDHIGFFGGQPSKNRRLLAAALGVGINEEINYEYEDLIGGKFIGSIIHKQKGNNVYDNIDEIRPLRVQSERPRPKPRTPVEVARDTFETQDDDLPF
jgi:hypothetical protein